MPSTEVRKCSHCGKLRLNHARNLCGSCYHLHKDKYKPVRPTGRKEAKDTWWIVVTPLGKEPYILDGAATEEKAIKKVPKHIEGATVTVEKSRY